MPARLARPQFLSLRDRVPSKPRHDQNGRWRGEVGDVWARTERSGPARRKTRWSDGRTQVDGRHASSALACALAARGAVEPVEMVGFFFGIAARNDKSFRKTGCVSSFQLRIKGAVVRPCRPGGLSQAIAYGHWPRAGVRKIGTGCN